MIDIDSATRITTGVKNKFILEEIEKLKELITRFNVDDRKCFIELGMISDYMNRLFDAKKDVESFSNFLKGPYCPVEPDIQAT